MPPPKVTVLITSYNTGRFLRAAIDSALSQDYEPLEVVVVNDGSKDDTGKILDSYGTRIVGIHQENRGCAGARNAGLEVSTGEVVIILDADDLLMPGAVSAKVRLLESESNVGLVTSVAGYINEDGDPIPGAVDLKPPYPNGVSYIDAMHRIPGPISGWAIPRYVLDEIGHFDASLRAVEDYDICLKILSKHKCLCDPEIRMLYREVSGSLSRDHSHNYDHIRRVIRKHRSLAPIGPASYWWNSRIMLLTSCAGVFTRIIREGGPHRKIQLFNFLRERPSALPYFLAWVARAGYNRLLYTFHRGPLHERDAAAKKREQELTVQGRPTA
jgi:glycosyltransferase involved in cell wall biosynthesis